MTYRDDNERLRVRLEATEEELAQARRRIDELEGRERDSGWSLFGPRKLKAERIVDGTLDEDTCDEILDALGDALETDGNIQRVGRRLRWQATSGTRAIAATVVERDGKLTITMSEQLGPLVGAVYGGGVGGIGGGFSAGAVAFGNWLGIPMYGAVIGWILLVFAGARVVYGNIARRRQRQLRAVVDRIDRALAAMERRKLRVDAAAAEDQDTEAEAEAEAAEEAQEQARRSS